MKAKFLACLALMAALLSISASAADEEAIYAAVNTAYSQYASSVYQANSADNAFEDFLIQGFFVNSGRMEVTAKDPIVSTVFNALLTRDSIVHAISRGIILMEELQSDVLRLKGGPGWHNYYYTFSYSGYLADEADYAYRTGTVASAKSIYGDVEYTGPRNRNDDALELLAGSLNAEILLRRTAEADGRAVYSIDISISDKFDFTSDYSAIAKKGFNTTTDSRLVKLGFLLQFIGLSTFDWGFSTPALSVEVPYDGAAAAGNYRWTYDNSTFSLINDSTNGFTANPTTTKERVTTSSSTGKVSSTHYYMLEDTVILRHDKPWVVSYDITPAKSFTLSPLETNTSSPFPALYHYGRNNVWSYLYEYIPADKAAGTKASAIYHYTGAEMKGDFKYASDRIYTYELENVPAADGSNMIYLSIFDHELHQRVYGPVALDTYWRKGPNESTRTLIGSDGSRIHGQDHIINYIGNKTVGIADPTADAPFTLDLRIYTEGTDQTLDWPDAPLTVTGTVTEPTGISVAVLRGGEVTDVKVSKKGSFTVTSEEHGFDIVVSGPGCLTTTFRNLTSEGCTIALGKFTPVRGDVNGDDMINIMDMAAFRQNFGLAGEALLNTLTDINADGMVNIMDMATFRQNFGMTAAKDCTTVYPL